MQFIVKPWFIIITFILAFLSGECLSLTRRSWPMKWLFLEGGAALGSMWSSRLYLSHWTVKRLWFTVYVVCSLNYSRFFFSSFLKIFFISINWILSTTMSVCQTINQCFMVPKCNFNDTFKLTVDLYLWTIHDHSIKFYLDNV